MTLQVQVADRTMITALEHPPPGLTIGDPAAKPNDGFLIWDVHAPDRHQLLGQWVSGAAGTHRNFYNGGRWVYATSTLPGFEGMCWPSSTSPTRATPRPPASGGIRGRTRRPARPTPPRTSGGS